MIKEDVYKKRPALWNALYLNDVVAEVPIVEDIQEDGEEETLGVAYTFNFGQYYGLEWCGVPQNYREWIVDKEVWKKRHDLWIALYEGGIVKEEPHLSHSDQSPKQQQIEQAKPLFGREKLADVEYTFSFGKYAGRDWNEVDEGYQDWIIKTKDVWSKRRDLWKALYDAGIVQEMPVEEKEDNGTILTITGLKFAKARASEGEYVSLIAEPDNVSSRQKSRCNWQLMYLQIYFPRPQEYDPNAINVVNTDNESIGHIKKEQAAALSKLLNKINMLQVEGIIANESNGYEQRVQIKIA